MNLPHNPVVKKSVTEIFKLLQMSAQKAKREPAVACPECGMTLAEFRQRGRMGCPRDYDLFAPQLQELLERVHGSTRHVGRRPGVDEVAQARMQRVSELRNALEAAIREEAYESAARIRDELKDLQAD
jgi:protein arginine kinase activator